MPKLATKVMNWLDPQSDDVILDIGCGGKWFRKNPSPSQHWGCQHAELRLDGVLDLQIAQVLSKGKGSLHGVDSSHAMIAAADKAAKDAGLPNCVFEVLDAADLVSKPELQKAQFTRVFSNAAMHWILRPQDKRELFFEGVKNALLPGGRFVFEMGGLGNVAEMRTALLMALGRRVGLEKAQEVDPWFFPDEDWVKEVMEEKVGGWKIEKIEREWRPTTADEGGVEGWLRLMGKQFFNALPAGEREACIKEAVDVLEVVCAKPGGGYMFSYVRLRAVAIKL